MVLQLEPCFSLLFSIGFISTRFGVCAFVIERGGKKEGGRGKIERGEERRGEEISDM
jgi:hypothetical protein